MNPKADDTRIAWQVLGSPVGVDLADDRSAELVSHLLSGFSQIEADRVSPTDVFILAATPRGLELSHGGRTPLISSSPGEIILDLLTRINRLAIESYSGLAVHAGAVTSGSQVIAFPGSTGAGKSTLTAACVVRGLEYVSDEALCVDFGTGRVEAYPRPLHLDPRAIETLGLEVPSLFSGCSESAITAKQLGGRLARGDLSLADVVFLNREPGRPRLSKLSRSQMAAGLLELSFNHYKYPSQAFELVADQARGARGWLLTFGDPLEGAATIQSIVR